ncbi:MAG: AsnC family transcriptional regulator [Candidatus Micrarchaeota archaeon]
MDDLDRQILELLQRDASMPLTKIAEILQVPKPTVYLRFNKMKENGIIRGFSIVLGSNNGMTAHAAIIKVRDYLLSEMGTRTVNRIGEAFSLRSEVLFAARISRNEIMVVWKGDTFNPAEYREVIDITKLDSAVFKAPQ